jgi:hypothetical protein
MGASEIDGTGELIARPSFIPSGTRADFGGSGNLYALAEIVPPSLVRYRPGGAATDRPPGGVADGGGRRYDGLNVGGARRDSAAT